MHKFRRVILFRWVTAILLVLAAAGWVGFTFSTQLQKESERSRNRAIQKIGMPPEAEVEVLRTSIEALDDMKIRHAGPPDFTPQANLMVKARPKREADVLVQTTEGDDEPQYTRAKVKVSMIVVSGNRRFAVLNGAVYPEGGFLPDGRRIAAINHDGVVLEIEGQTEDLAWTQPTRVMLQKAEMEKPAAQVEAAQEEADASEKEVQSAEEAREKAKAALQKAAAATGSAAAKDAVKEEKK